MDLNQLYFDHQLLIMKADRAGSGGARRYRALASCIADRIGGLQRASGAAAAPAWETLAAGACRLPAGVAAPRPGEML